MQPLVPTHDTPIEGPAASTSAAANPTSISGVTAGARATPKASVTNNTPLYAKRPSYATKIGTITLPTLRLSWAIFEGTSASQLARGVGHYRQSVLPGEKNNSVLSGHRSTVFNRLGELRKNNLIYVKTSAGTFTYRVRSFRIVRRTTRTVIVPTKTAVLTLTTCWPFNHFGTTTQAFIVSADLIASTLSAK